MAGQNRTLGRFDLVGIPPAPRGVPQVEVTFDIDANGIVHVSAKDLGTGKEQKIRIEASSGLNEADIDKMVHEAEAHAEEDKRERERIEARNEADALIYQTEKTIKDLGDKVGAGEKEAIENAVKDLRKAMEGADLEAIKQKTETLKQASYKLSEELYKHAQGAAGPGQAQGGGPEGGFAGQPGQDASGADQNTKNADDVDYKVVDDEDKK